MFFFSRHGPMTDLATGIKLVFLYSGPSVSITRLNPKLSELSITPDRHIEGDHIDPRSTERGSLWNLSNLSARSARILD